MAITVVPVLGFALLLATGFGRYPRALPSELIDKHAPRFTLTHLGGDGETLSIGDAAWHRFGERHTLASA